MPGLASQDRNVPVGHRRPGLNATAKSSLSPGCKRLVELMQRVNFGRIEGIAVRDGEPVFDPPPRVVRKLKIGGDNGSRQEMGSTDFALRREVAELIEHLGRLGTGTVRCIEVKYGLPFLIEVEEVHTA